MAKSCSIEDLLARGIRKTIPEDQPVETGMCAHIENRNALHTQPCNPKQIHTWPILFHKQGLEKAHGQRHIAA